ncbi:hypothetical protein GmHk_13G036570 [Glycine max]|nr:hypothetical protein GmHk_13G036570 [Glycine max]
MARTKKTSQMTSEAAKEIADKIDSMKEQASQGSFVAHGRQDVLIAAIGRPEHPGHVCVAGASVTIKQYFGLAPRTSCMSSSMALEDLEQLTQKIREAGGGLALPPEPEDGPSSARLSIKKSCVDPSGNDLDMGPEKLADRPNHDVDDPLYLMTLTIPQLFLKPLQVMWDATIFGVFNDNFPLYIKHEDLSEIAHSGQCLSISVIQLWIL